MILKRVGKRVKVNRRIFGRYVRFFNQWLNKPSSSADRHALYREVIALPESLLNNMQPRGARCKFRGSQAFSRLLGELRVFADGNKRNVEINQVYFAANTNGSFIRSVNLSFAMMFHISMKSLPS